MSDKKLMSAIQAGQMADDYARARKDIPSAGKDTSHGQSDRKRCDNCGREGCKTKDCHSLPSDPKGGVSQNFGLSGHIAAKGKKAMHQGKETVGCEICNGVYSGRNEGGQLNTGYQSC